MDRRSGAFFVIFVPMLLALAGCSGSGGSDDAPPTLDRIDGPAVVDPSFDPFATDPAAPPVTEGG